MKLAGKTAVVTGGATGIGEAIAVALADEGCRVAITGRRQAKIDEAIARYRGATPLVGRACDVGEQDDVEQVFNWVSQELGAVDMLINSAGVNVVRRSMAELDPADWEKMMRINVSGAYYCMRAVLPQMRERGDGLIVNISSISGKRASLLGGVGYAASKFAMTALGMTVALEDGQYGIRVTNVYPGEVETPILDNRPTPVTAEHRARILQPQDVGAAVLMIACLPPRAHVSELVIKPTSQPYA